jgi:hypothetical protein
MDSQYSMMKAKNSVASIKSAPVASWVLKFGKYKDKTYAEVKKDDHAYLKYLLEQGAFDDDKYEKTNARIKEYITA